MSKRIGELLVAAGAVTPVDVERALAEQRGPPHRRLGEVLVATGRVTPEVVARALAQQFELPFIQLPEIPSKVSALLPLEFQAQHRLIPFRLEVEGKLERIHLAMADPTNMDPVDELRFQINKPIKVYLAAWDDVDSALAALMGGDAETVVIDEDEEPAAAAPAPAPVTETVELPMEWSLETSAKPHANGTGNGNGAVRREPAPLPVITPAILAETRAAQDASGANGWDLAIPDSVPRSAMPAADPLRVANPLPVMPAVAPIPMAAPAAARAAPMTPPVPTPVAPAPAVPPRPVTPVSSPVLAAPVPPPVPKPALQVTPVSTPVVVAPAPKAAPPMTPISTPIVTASVPVPVPPLTPVATPVVVSAPVPSPAPPAIRVSPVQNPAVAQSLPPTVIVTLDAPALDDALPSFDIGMAEDEEEPAPPPAPKPAPPADPRSQLEFSESDLQVLEALEQLAGGAEATIESSKVKPPQMVASLIRLLIKKGVIDELEFLEELGRK